VAGDLVDAGELVGEVGAVDAVCLGGDPLGGGGDDEVGFEVARAGPEPATVWF
jgi:hypothetical protein